MEKHCVSLELANQLKKAGWKKETKFYWVKEKTNECESLNAFDLMIKVGEEFIPVTIETVYENFEVKRCDYFSAPLATEILEELPSIIEREITEINTFGVGTLYIARMVKGTYVVEYCDGDMNVIKEFGDLSLPNALAKMWIYLKKEGLLK